MAEWQAGLSDLEDQGLGPSATNPLTAAGLDPDVVRANPDLLAAMGTQGIKPQTSSVHPAAPPQPGPMAAQPGETDDAKPSVSAVAAGKTGGAAAAPTPIATPAPAPAVPDTPYAEAMGGLAGQAANEKMANEAAASIPTTNPRRCWNQRAATVAPSTSATMPVPRPMSTPQSATSCQTSVIAIDASTPDATIPTAARTTGRTRRRAGWLP